jgi:hypothetical protein
MTRVSLVQAVCGFAPCEEQRTTKPLLRHCSAGGQSTRYDRLQDPYAEATVYLPLFSIHLERGSAPTKGGGTYVQKVNPCVAVSGRREMLPHGHLLIE